MLVLTLVIFSIFVMFQILYITIPLLNHKRGTELPEKLPELGLTILVPAFNEQHVIKQCILGALRANYQNHELIIINDGSTDDTLGILESFLRLEAVEESINRTLTYKTVRGFYYSTIYPNVYVIDKSNGGKADALNAGIDYANNDIVVTLDADSILDSNSLQAMNSCFHDDSVIAAGGMVHIVQGAGVKGGKASPNFAVRGIIRYQIMQYLTSFYLHKFVQAKFKAMTVIAGAFGAFRRSTLLELNGFRNTVGEDMDITLKIQRLIYTKERDKKMMVVSEAVCYTECPENFRNLFKQRIRWQKAFVDCIITYGHCLFSQFSFGLSVFFLIEGFMLGTLIAFNTLLVPLVLILSKTGHTLVLTLLTIYFILALCQSLVAFLVSKRFGHSYSKSNYARILSFIPLEIITYRLLGLLWVTAGTIQYFYKKQHWDKVERCGKIYTLNELPVEVNESKLA
ncbi:glycosyltransferase family 2 protein [Dethiobacter alkaliphilus]|uniref:Glycosyl transferase family 2 n=1 Tax=Dethiobacter alkaliphilus AHT 1 TaxID=555088 RepID=C0GFE2_DETAL|nr:glycosyltransferase [Dethiobacter alkaliphilus]EEG77902.1 glycosyl transferase family 2 [Dethiobacter alkaliphilus AHT 1]